MIKWNLFRGRLANTLHSAALLNDLEEKRYGNELEAVEERSQGKVKASILEAFLNENRADLPLEYLPLLCSSSLKLGLFPADYGGKPGLARADYGEPQTPAVAQEPAPTKQLSGTRQHTKQEKVRAPVTEESTYIALDCNNTQAMQKAFLKRIDSAGITPLDLAWQFSLAIRASKCPDLERFFNKKNVWNTGPAFGFRLQERFWVICELLNDTIHEKTGNSTIDKPTTEEFIRTLFREGTVRNIDEKLRVLKTLNEQYAALQGETVAETPYTQFTPRELARKKIQEVWNKEELLRKRPQTATYVVLECKVAGALSGALSNRLSRADISNANLGRLFGFKVTKSRFVELSAFLGRTDEIGNISFPRRLQELFWDICAYLNDEIHKREGGDQQTTEQFVHELLREGTVYDIEERLSSLKLLSEHYHEHIAPKKLSPRKWPQSDLDRAYNAACTALLPEHDQSADQRAGSLLILKRIFQHQLNESGAQGVADYLSRILDGAAIYEMPRSDAICGAVKAGLTELGITLPDPSRKHRSR